MKCDTLDRKVDQGGADVALRRVSFCLDQIEKIVETKIPYFELFPLNFYKDFMNLSCEEVIGALVACEQALKDCEVRLYHE